MNNICSCRVVTCFLLPLFLILSACAPKAKPLSVNVAIVDQAGLLLYADSATISKSPFVVAVKEYKDIIPAQDQDDVLKSGQELMEATGLTEDDLLEILFSVANLEKVAEENYDDLSLTLAATFRKEINVDALFAFLSKKTDENGDKLTREEFEGVPLFRGTFHNINAVSPQQSSEDLPAIKLLIALINLNGNSLLIAGDDVNVKASVSRFNQGSSGDLSRFANMQRAFEKGTQAWGGLILPENAKTKIKGVAPVLNIMMGVPFDACAALGTLTEISLSAKASDVLNLKINLALGSEENAKALQSVVSDMLIAMIKSRAQSELGPASAAADSLKAVATGVNVSLSVQMEESDIKLMSEKAAEATAE